MLGAISSTAPWSAASSVAPTATSENGRATRSRRERLHVVGGDERDAAEGLVEVGELAERELGAAEPRHPGVGVLEGERRRARELPGGAAQLVGGDAVFGDAARARCA